MSTQQNYVVKFFHFEKIVPTDIQHWAFTETKQTMYVFQQ